MRLVLAALTVLFVVATACGGDDAPKATLTPSPTVTAAVATATLTPTRTTTPSPSPTPPRTPPPTASPTRTPTPPPTQPLAPAASTQQPAAVEPYYANCAAARAAGAAPLRRGQPGYRAALDRDGDGIACE